MDAAITVLAADPRGTLADVAREAGVGRATLHRYFSSRDELVSVLALESIKAIDDACADIDYYGQSATLSLRQVLQAIAPLGARYAFLAYQSTHNPEVATELERQLRQMRELVEAARAEGTFSPDVPIAWIVTTIDHLIYAAWTAVSKGTIAPQDVADLVFRTITRGLGGH